MLVPRDRPLAAQSGERAVDIIPEPEVEAPGVDLVEGEARGGSRNRDIAHGTCLRRSSRCPGLPSEYRIRYTRVKAKPGDLTCEWSSTTRFVRVTRSVCVWCPRFSRSATMIGSTCGRSARPRP